MLLSIKMLRINNITKGKKFKNAVAREGKNKVITFNPKVEGTQEITVEGKLTPLPNSKKRDVLYISAPSGAGKTYWVSQYIKEYKKMFKNNEVYFISSIQYDKVIDDIKDVIRINIDEETLEHSNFELDDFTDSLVVFDDVDTITNKAIKNYIERLRDYLLEQGRHSNTSMCLTHHLLTNYKATRIMLNESTGYILFPKVNGVKLKKFLENYCGIGNDEYNKIKSLPTRWIYIVRSYPHYLIYEKGVYIL